MDLSSKNLNNVYFKKDSCFEGRTQVTAVVKQFIQLD